MNSCSLHLEAAIITPELYLFNTERGRTEGKEEGKIYTRKGDGKEEKTTGKEKVRYGRKRHEEG